MNYLQLTLEEIQQQITEQGLNAFFTEVGRNLSEYSFDWLEENLPKVLIKINSAYTNIRHSLGYVPNAESIQFACFINGYIENKPIEALNNIIHLIHTNPLLENALLWRVLSISKYGYITRVLSPHLKDLFQRIVIQYELGNMTSSYDKQIRPRSFGLFIELSHHEHLHDHLMTMRNLGLSLTFVQFREIVAYLNEQMSTHLEKKSQSGKTNARSTAISSLELEKIQTGEMKRATFIQVISPILIEDGVTLTALTELMSCIDTYLQIENTNDLKKIIFNALKRQPYFNSSFAQSTGDFYQLLLPFPSQCQIELFSLFKDELPRFCLQTYEFSSVLELIINQHTLQHENFHFIMSFLNGDIRTTAINILYANILKQCEMRDYHLVYLRNEVDLDEIPSQLPPHFKEGYVRHYYVKTTTDGKVTKIENSAYYVDTRIGLCYQLPLPKGLAIDDFDKIQPVEEALPIEVVAKLATYLKTKRAQFYCHEWGSNSSTKISHISTMTPDLIMCKLVELTDSMADSDSYKEKLINLTRALKTCSDTKPQNQALDIVKIKYHLIDVYFHVMNKYNSSALTTEEKKNLTLLLQFICGIFNQSYLNQTQKKQAKPTVSESTQRLLDKQKAKNLAKKSPLAETKQPTPLKSIDHRPNQSSDQKDSRETIQNQTVSEASLKLDTRPSEDDNKPEHCSTSSPRDGTLKIAKCNDQPLKTTSMSTFTLSCICASAPVLIAFLLKDNQTSYKNAGIIASAALSGGYFLWKTCCNKPTSDPADSSHLSSDRVGPR